MQTPASTADTTDRLNDLTVNTTVAAEAMQSVFGMSPHGWQEQAISHIIALFKNNSCAPLLLVPPTGGGKSAVRDTLGVILAGVVLTISPLLSLAADQADKVRSRASQEFGNVLSFHLDEIRDRDEQLAVAASISNMVSKTTQTVFLFASPQVFVNNPIWRKLLDAIIQKKLLRFVAVDEIHLFVLFARSFRQEFAWLKPYLFSKLQSRGSTSRTTVPVLFMTATCNESILNKVELLSGLTFHVANIFWPQPKGMRHRNVSFDITYSSRPLGLIQPALKKLLNENDTSKYIIYSNRRGKIEGIHSKLSLWLDCNDFHLVDTVSLVGTLTPEQKSHHIKAFVNSAVDDDFHPRILTATSGAANAGIDSSQVFGVFRVDFPPNMVDMKQEGGRAGRRTEGLIVEDFYCVMISLEGFLHLFLRIQNPDESVHDSSYREQQLADLLSTLKFLVLPSGCFHDYFEQQFSSPFWSGPLRDDPCGNRCSFCDGTYDQMFPHISQNGVLTVFFELFIVSPNVILDIRRIATVIEAIKSMSNSARLIFGTNSTKPLAPILVKKLLLLLIAAGRYSSANMS
jgi:superfamily II DNA helicase RecQ